MSAPGKSDLKLRVITGLIGASVFLGLLLKGGILGAQIIAGFISLGALYEYAHMTFQLPDRRWKTIVLLLSGLVIGLGVAVHRIPVLYVSVALFMGTFTVYLLTAKYHAASGAFREHLHEFVFSVFGVIYLGVLPWFLPELRAARFGLHFLVLFMLMNWGVDIAAYFFGRAFGKHKLYVEVSPKKSWEGAIGGWATGVVIALIYRAYFFHSLPVGHAVLISTVICVLAQIGDLAESYFKRVFDTKDSGSLLPGHGGLMDRFDGVLFSIPAMYACVQLLGY